MSAKNNRCRCGGLRHKHDIERIAELEECGQALGADCLTKLERINELRERIAELEAAIPLLREVMAWHRDNDGSEYHGCDVDPCMWCYTARKLLQEQEK